MLGCCAVPSAIAPAQGTSESERDDGATCVSAGRTTATGRAKVRSAREARGQGPRTFSFPCHLSKSAARRWSWSVTAPAPLLRPPPGREFAAPDRGISHSNLTWLRPVVRWPVADHIESGSASLGCGASPTRVNPVVPYDVKSR